MALKGQRATKRAESRLVRLLARALALAMLFILSLDNNNGRKPAICNRLQPQNMLTHSPQKPQSTTALFPSLSLPLPLALSLLSTDAIIDLICNCFMSGKIRVSICMTNSQCNLPIKLDGCPTVSLFLSFSLSLPLQSLSITV